MSARWTKPVKGSYLVDPENGNTLIPMKSWEAPHSKPVVAVKPLKDKNTGRGRAEWRKIKEKKVEEGREGVEKKLWTSVTRSPSGTATESLGRTVMAVEG